MQNKKEENNLRLGDFNHGTPTHMDDGNILCWRKALFIQLKKKSLKKYRFFSCCLGENCRESVKRQITQTKKKLRPTKYIGSIHTYWEAMIEVPKTQVIFLFFIS